ncbi:LIC20036 family protein [Leptospira kmetyi]|uniref:LIC20036 family protein n=1 Tax=Leptospira kmetyi TaxID=408139 RepID=UPI003EB95E58
MSTENSPRSFWKRDLTIFIPTAILFFIIGYLLRSCGPGSDIGRTAKVTYNGSFTQGILVSMDRKILKITDPDQEIPTDSVEKIEFLAEAKPSDSAELSANDKLFVGTYQLTVGPHKGTLQFFGGKNGRLYGILKFSNWGKGKAEPLGGIFTKGNQIQFVRSCVGAKCSEIGSNVPFSQKYSGVLEGRSISGTYRGNNSSGNWDAKR